MLRGSIELITEKHVSGWIHSPHLSLRELSILAFVRGHCVGASTVSIHRQDLQDAGLGDGMLGYDIPLKLLDPADVADVIVRLEGADAALLQSDGSSMHQAGFATRGAKGVRGNSSLRWMLSQGRLDQSEFDWLDQLEKKGVYNRFLTASRKDILAGHITLNAKEMMQTLFELYHMSGLVVAEVQVIAVSDLEEMFKTLKSPSGVPPVVGLRSLERARLGVTEGSHLSSGQSRAIGNHSKMEYALAPDQILLLNTACTFEPVSPAPTSGIAVYYVESLVET